MPVYKYSGWSFGDVEALINVVGEENARALIAGDLVLQCNGQIVQIQEAIRALFDKNGRRIPPKGLVANVCDADRDFHLNQPKLDYGLRLARFDQTGLVSFISAADFAARAEALITQLRENERTSNLLKGTYLPIVVPQTKVSDLGKSTEEFVTAAGDSYLRQFPDRAFNNYRKGELEKQVTIVLGSRYQQLTKSIEKESVVGIYFPSCLQGFSVEAQREQMHSIPEGFILSGPLDTAMGWMMYPDVLGRDYKTPGNDCSAVQWRSPGGSLDFGALDDCADFGDGSLLSFARSRYSGGLFFLG